MNPGQAVLDLKRETEISTDMSDSMITAIATGVPAIIAAITSLIVAIKAHGTATAAKAAVTPKTIPESTAGDPSPGH